MTFNTGPEQWSVPSNTSTIHITLAMFQQFPGPYYSVHPTSNLLNLSKTLLTYHASIKEAHVGDCILCNQYGLEALLQLDGHAAGWLNKRDHNIMSLSQCPPISKFPPQLYFLWMTLINATHLPLLW